MSAAMPRTRHGGRRRGFTPVARRVVTCVFCHVRIGLRLAMKTAGLCERCREREVDANGGRVVFDRDAGIGEAPASLRERYGVDAHGRPR